LTTSINRIDWGSVSPGEGSFPVGSAIDLTALPNPYYAFVEWQGDVSGSVNPMSLVLTTNLAIHAVFRELVTTNHSVPLAWLAEHGVTADVESAVDLPGANGVPLWQSYVAGLDPNDPNSRFVISVTPDPDGTVVVLQWNTVPDRVYTVWQRADLDSEWLPISGATNLPFEIQSITSPLGTAGYYRVDVRLAPAP